MDSKTLSYADVYAQMFNEYKNKLNNKPIVNQADEQEQKEEEEKPEKQDQEEDIDLDFDDEEGQNEETDQKDQDQEELNLDDLDEQPQIPYNPDNYGEENVVKLNFSVELATEFSNTVNQFTKTCADIVKNRSVKKTVSDDLDKLMRKIKNIVQAAEDSV